jgi:hypothetical protein
VRSVFRFTAGECVPQTGAVLAAQGMPPALSGRTSRLFEQALHLFRELAAPAAVCEEVGREDFGRIYQGEGRNAAETPLALAYPQAERLDLFCVTLGQAISSETGRRFEEGDFALGFVLDAVASAGAERLCDLVQQRWSDVRRMGNPESEVVLRYSPGYCGWHVTGQRRLFERLRPGEVGVTLRESCLMEPLKSVSGVLVAGSARPDACEDEYPFCADCTSRACREQVAAV